MSSEQDERIRPPDEASDGVMVGGESEAETDAEAAVAQARLAAIVTGSEDAIVAKTLEGIITAWNPAAERLFGYTAEEIIGRSVLTIIPPELHFEEPGILARIGRGERISHFETVRLRKDGTRFPAALTISPIRDAAGQIIGASKILRDISERKALEAERAQYREQLEEQALELELTNQQLQDNAAELEMQAEELQVAALALEERTEEAEASRATLAAILEAVTDGFVALDDALRYTFVNQRAAEMWGVPPERLIGKTPRQVWGSAADASPFVSMFERVRVSGRPEVREGDATSLGVPIEARAYPASGGGVVVFFSDITERRRQEEAAAFLADASQLLASSGDYETTLRDLAAAAVPRLGDWCAVDVLSDPDSTAWPPRIERVAVAHQDPEKIELTRSLTALFPQDWSRDIGTPGVLRTREPSFIPDVTDAMLVASAQNEEHLAMLRQLGIRSLIIVPLVARDRVLGVITLVMAESDRRFTSADLALAVDLGRRAGVAVDNARLLRDAQEANAAKSQFLANMSHELRQPLNAITGYAELMAMGARGAVTEEQQRDLERIRTSSSHLTALISDILEFARIETGQLSYSPADLSVDAALADVSSLIALQADQREQRFTYERCDPTLVVRADPDRFRQVMVNLLTNASKYTPAGGSITLSCSVTGPDDSTVAIRVTDTGVGIPASKLRAIFDPFVQVHRSLNQPSEGVGLGLAIARDIARHMDGDVTVESEEGVGSTFTFTLPRA